VKTVRRSELRLGELLAEGGEGRVFEVLSGGPELGWPRVYKELRRPCPVPELSALVSFPSVLASADAVLSARVLSSSAWPACVVVGGEAELALGTVMPRAPQEFWVRHRDGANRLASLSYLANDPDRLAVAYGVLLPAPGAPERVALVYALARLLDAWQSGPPRPQVVHGDLSAKNILWSLQAAPSVYVLDCDGATVTAGGQDDPDCPPGPDEAGEAGETGGPGGPGGTGSADGPADRPRRHRATTLNWGDPAAARGRPPTASSDRYLLAITFLRVVGAAHFPVQGRQKAGQKLDVDLELPRSWRKLPDMPELWGLCERSLSLVNPADRPTPGEWALRLEELLGALSATELAVSARQAQGDPRPALSSVASSAGPSPGDGAGPVRERRTTTVPDVVVRPVLRHRPPSTWQLISAAPPLGVGGEVLPGLAGGLGLGRAGSGGGARGVGGALVGVSGAHMGSARPGGTGAGGAGPSPLTPRQMAGRVMVMWAEAHRVAARWARSRGQRAYGLRRLAGVFLLDLAAACVTVFVVAMIISPWIGL
jgi:Phosphotransferase enzyme family